MLCAIARAINKLEQSFTPSSPTVCPGAVIIAYNSGVLKSSVGSLVSLHRPDFQKVLLRHLPKTCRTYCKKRLRSYSEQPSGVVHLVFEDGTAATCDILIGADGLKSSVRATLLQDRAFCAQSEGRPKEAREILSAVQPVWTGTIAHRALIPSETLRAQSPHHAALKTPTQVSLVNLRLGYFSLLTCIQYLGKNGVC